MLRDYNWLFKTRLLTVTLAIGLLNGLTGCASKESPQATAASPSPGPTSPAVQTVVDRPTIAPSAKPEPTANAIVQKYIQGLSDLGFSKDGQGVWIQSSDTLLTTHQATTPLPAASLTKVATTLATLQVFNPDRQFVTEIGVTGPIQNGVLNGDLVITGEGDPLFVWEEAIALGNTLNKNGIKRVTGNLIVTGKFYMNFEVDRLKAGELLQQGLNSQIWPSEAETQYQTLPPNTPRPQLVIEGAVKVVPTPPANVKPFARHYSFPVAELVKKMNQYSNNLMADMLADAVGGPQKVAQYVADIAGFPISEIQLVNGSGLSEENRISPRAVCAMLLALERYLQPYNMTVADVLAVVGKDTGILNERKIPRLAVVKSGTLDTVSALAGALPTQKQGTIWFVLMNTGSDIEGFRAKQEALLNIFLKQWGSVATSPSEIAPNPERKSKVSRTEIVQASDRLQSSLPR